MTRAVKLSILALRLAIGWLLFYAGISKIVNPEWSAAGYLENASSFPGLFGWFALPQNIGWVNFLNEWGLTLVGLALILGVAVRYASIGGGLLMLLYYFPVLEFPYAGHGIIVDDHLIYLLVFILFYVTRAGRFWGLDRYFTRHRANERSS